MLVKNNFNLREFNSYRIDAVCDVAFFPENEEDLRLFFKEIRKDLIILGGGYNTIFSKNYYKNPFLIFADPFSSIEVDGDIFIAEAGVSMLKLSEMAHQNSLSGLEIFYDIPSSLGGAVVMNAGASGEEIKDLLIKVRYFDPETFVFHDILKEDINFEYRNSLFQKKPHLIVIKAWLKLNYGDKEAIFNKMNYIKSTRWAKQPRNLPNAGSVFKRPPGRYVGPMIDELGLKGFAIGDAQVSEKHGGFIVNKGCATGEDIIQLINEVKDRVYKKFGVDLEIEQRIV